MATPWRHHRAMRSLPTYLGLWRSAPGARHTGCSRQRGMKRAPGDGPLEGLRCGLEVGASAGIAREQCGHVERKMGRMGEDGEGCAGVIGVLLGMTAIASSVSRTGTMKRKPLSSLSYPIPKCSRVSRQMWADRLALFVE
jgi:hypothetical protein